MDHFQELVQYKQYNLRRGNEYTSCWLNNPDLKLYTKVKIADDPFWWVVIGMGKTIKTIDETPESCLW